MKRRLAGRCAKWAVAVVLAMSPASALAAEDDSEVVDARLQGFSSNVQLPASSEGLIWVTMILMAAVCVGGLFKDAKRSHLD